MTPNTGQDITSSKLGRAKKIATAFDSLFVVPGTNKSIGLDGIVGLVPGIGDSISSLVSAYIVYLAYLEGLPRTTLLRMVLNILVDSLVGVIPLLGDLGDFFWKANVRNVQLWESQLPSDQPHVDNKLFIAGVIVGLVTLVGGILYASIWLLSLVWDALQGQGL